MNEGRYRALFLRRDGSILHGNVPGNGDWGPEFYEMVDFNRWSLSTMPLDAPAPTRVYGLHLLADRVGLPHHVYVER